MMLRQYDNTPQEERKQVRDFKSIFGSLTEGAFIYDHDGIIQLINPAAIKLLGLRSEADCLGRPYQCFLQLYETEDSDTLIATETIDPMMIVLQSSNTSPCEFKHVYLQRSDERIMPVDVYCAPILDFEHQPQRGLCLIHHDHHQKKEQRINASLTTFLSLIHTFPVVSDTIPLGEEDMALLASPEMQVVAQRITDLLCIQLECENVWLVTADIEQQRILFVAMSGFTRKREQMRYQAAENYPISAFIDRTMFKHMLTQGFLITRSDQLITPPELRADLEGQSILHIPLLSQQNLVGMLSIGRNRADNSTYSIEEIDLARSIGALVTLILRQYRLHSRIARLQASEQALRESNQRMNEFLNLASHEFRTPLTVVMGNLQLTKRRLQNGRKHLTDEQWNNRIDPIVHSLDDAIQGTRLQERMINDMLDDSRIQAGTLRLHMQHLDLCDIVHTVVSTQRQQNPDRIIRFDTEDSDQPIYAMLDHPRITRVVDTYLRNALDYSPIDKPIIVSLQRERKTARVAVSDEGPGVPYEEQDLIWTRFYRTTGVAVQHELDLSLGLGLYLCRTFIERHSGQTGLDSIPGKGATFWFTLPLAPQTD